MVDMEGISGICRKSQVLPGGEHYQQGRQYLTWDVNACVDGCFAGGADEVVVRDAHGGGYHFLWHELDERAEYIQGRSPHDRMPGIGGCDALILLGYHAMAGTQSAILEHTMSSVAWQNFWLNGEKAGEVAIDAGIAGDAGVPTIMVSGDDKVCTEALEIIPELVAVETKRGLDVEGGILLSRDVAHKAIRDGARNAVADRMQIAPFRVPRPVEMKLELVSRGHVPAGRPGVKVLDGRTFSVRADGVEAALKLITG